MSSNETNSTFDAMSAAIRATTKLSNDAEKPEELTPALLASAIKLAALSSSNQEQLTTDHVNAAIKVATESSNQKKQDEKLTPESLAIALKLATKVSSNDNDKEDADESSADQMLAALKAAVALTQQNQSNNLVTSELLSDALKLAKE